MTDGKKFEIALHSAHLQETTHSSVTFSLIKTVGELSRIDNEAALSVKDNVTCGLIDHDKDPDSKKSILDGIVNGDELYGAEKGARKGEVITLVLSCELSFAVSRTSIDENCQDGRVASE